MEILKTCISNYVPEINYKNTNISQNKPWINSRIKKLINKNRNIVRRNKSNKIWKIMYNNNLNIINKARDEYYKQEINKFPKNSQDFWEYGWKVIIQIKMFWIELKVK